MRVVGIDWASDAKNRAAVLLRLAEGFRGCAVIDVLEDVLNQDACDLCVDPTNDAVAVDVPFGWPREFARFVEAWRPHGTIELPKRMEFRFRTTDRVVHREVGKIPLSVSTDRLSLAALSWVELVSTHHLGGRVDTLGELREGGPSIIEVYPSASAPILVDPPDGYTKKSASKRRELVEKLAARFEVTFGDLLDRVVGDGEASHATDAFVAALTAAVYRADLADQTFHGFRIRRPNPDERDDAAREGWMFFPRRAV